MITLTKLTKCYRPEAKAAVLDVDLSVAGGEFLALVGPSGCGKTTLLSMINRLVEPSSGKIAIDGTDITQLDPVTLRRGIGFVFQDVGLFPHLTVGENAAITLKLTGQKQIQERTQEVLELVRLPAASFSDRDPATLSGGQRQRAGLARALAAKPRIMLMDEPFGALDPLIRDELGQDYRSLHERLELTTILVTHDMTEAILLADRIAVMREGQVVQVAPPREMVANPADDFVELLIQSPRRRALALAAVMETK